MSASQVLLWLTLLGVLVLIGFTVAEHGYPPLLEASGPGVKSMFETLLATWPGRLSMVSQSIAIILIMIWIWFDSGKQVSVIATYSAITVVLGIPGPLIYLIRRRRSQARSSEPDGASST